MEDDREAFASYPTKFDGNLLVDKQVFWSQHLKNSASDDDWDIHERIKSAFCKFNTLNNKKGLIVQFWAPVQTTTGRLLLSTSNQPFAPVHINTRVRKYRLCSREYQYDVHGKQVDEKEPTILIGGPAAAAFLNRSPEVVLDTSAQHSSLMVAASACDLKACVMLPVFYSRPKSVCVGVVECSTRTSKDLIASFCDMKRALESAGLSLYPVQESQTIEGFKLATDEIENAIRIACLAHDLILAQVWWIPNETSVPSSSDTQTKETFLKKSNSYHTVTKNPHLSSFVEFYNNCHVLPFKTEEGLVGKTLQTFQPHFCKNISKLKRVGGLFGLLSAINTNIKCSCLAISSRSNHTGDTVNYVFEFFWHQYRDSSILSGSLISTLKRYLPSFKFHSGSQLGADELCVKDVENSAASDVGTFRVPDGNRLSQTHRACDKRKFSEFSSKKDSTSVQNPLTNSITKKTYVDDDVDNDLVIVARYAENVTLFLLPTLTALVEAKENISYDFDLDPHSFTLEDERDDGTCYRLDDEESFMTCIDVCRLTQKSYIKLRVHPRG